MSVGGLGSTLQNDVGFDKLLYLFHGESAIHFVTVILYNKRNIIYLPVGKLRRAVRLVIRLSYGVLYLLTVKCLLGAVPLDDFHYFCPFYD